MSVMSTSTCKSCGQHSEAKKVDKYETDQFGITLTLLNAVTIKSCGCDSSQEISIPNLKGMLAAAALTRISHSLKLSGKEISFLRKAVGYSAKELASFMDVTPETFSRWENDKLPIKSASEKFLRLFVMSILKDNAPLVNPSEKDIATMEIVGFGQPGKTLPISLQLIKYKDTQKKDMQEDYDKIDKAA